MSQRTEQKIQKAMDDYHAVKATKVDNVQVGIDQQNLQNAQAEPLYYNLTPLIDSKNKHVSQYLIFLELP